MKYLAACALLLFSLSTRAQTKPKANYPYLLYLPKTYTSDTKHYPLLIYLHGGSQKGNDLNKLKTYGLPHLIDKGKAFEFIVASPQCPEGKYWSTENWFDSLYVNLTRQYRIDTNRVYMTGISMGGYGALIVALDNPTKFAAIAPLCGGVNDSDTSRICQLKNVPVWAFHGTADEVIAPRETARVATALKKCGGAIRYTRLKDRGHDLQDLYETKPQLYTWLLKHKR
jgi:predicted peptidase